MISYSGGWGRCEEEGKRRTIMQSIGSVQRTADTGSDTRLTYWLFTDQIPSRPR
jgi:hypothetical protein